MKRLSPYFDQEGRAAIIGMRDGRTYTAFVVHGKDAARRVVASHSVGDGSRLEMLSLVENSPLPGSAVLVTELVDGGSAEIVQEALAAFGEFMRRNAGVAQADVDTALANTLLTFTKRGRKTGGLLTYRDPDWNSHVFAFCTKRQARKYVRQGLFWLDETPCSAIYKNVEASDLDERPPANDVPPRREVHITGELATRIRMGLYLRATKTKL